MVKSIYKIALVLAVNLIISAPLYAKLVEEKNINFPINAKALLKGDIYYYFSTSSPQKFALNFPILTELDSLSLMQESNVRIVLNKTVFLIHKPVGFFDDQQLMDGKYLKHIMGEQVLKNLGPTSYQVTVPGKMNHTYKMNTFFDADDVSNLPNSKIMRAVAAAKKLDIITQGASNIMFVEKTNFTKFTEGAVTVSSFIPMKENETLVITYHLWAIQKPFASAKVLKEDFLTEAESVRDLINSFVSHQELGD